MSMLRIWAAALLFQFITLTASIPTISTSGTKFYDSNGNQFYIKGVVYGASNLIDVLANTAQCQRDASLMQTLGVNTVRVYYVDPTEDHDGCMLAFEDAGIYALVALDSPYSAINRISPEWTTTQYSNFTAVMDAFANYNNTLGFVAGNEVINNISQSDAALYVKASALDLKKYRDGKGYREIPVGYTGADVIDLMPVLQNYLACGTYAVDFFGQNSYSWCGSSSFTESGYSEEYADASSYSIPIFFSETGCNLVQPRPFTDQAAILSADMENLWSGSIIYEWLEEANDYGLVDYVASATLSGTPTPLATGGFSNLMSQWATLNPTGTPSSMYTPNVTPPSCPSSTASGWLINGNAALPTLNKAVVSTRSSTSSSSSTSQTSNTSTSKSSKQTEAAPAVASGSATTTGDGSGSTSDPEPAHNGSISAGAIAGIAIGVLALLLAVALAAFLLWRRRRQQQAKATPPLDLTPEGLEVGEPPVKPELDSSTLSMPAGQHEPQPELQDTSSSFPSNGNGSTSSPALTAALSLAEMGNSPTSQRVPSTLLASELSTTPSTPKLATSQQQQSVTRRPVASKNEHALKANAPWETEAFPYPQAEITTAQAQQTPLLASTEDDDELKQLEDEERRIDAQIAESERITALKEEKLALQAKKAALLAAKEKTSRT
ncbi:uncharacterized protein LY89DRAFT_50312 [Mollisia scopiformis]|uniref:1,3-beta-glucanosyltransferase n=1 Tax=Mollisia scopiformis TaxID=149040 RepID=A0A194XAX8_MOLSC|nr:uncharacterized protein LY89DRAFT_50312 [Mollisia scopiformis]KUJ17299.1 hypothetical protein LY89DRAFT_50312 [Mollisia scopiformis]